MAKPLVESGTEGFQGLRKRHHIMPPAIPLVVVHTEYEEDGSRPDPSTVEPQGTAA